MNHRVRPTRLERSRMPLAVVTDYTFPTLEIEEAILSPLREFRGGKAKMSQP